MKSSVNQNIPEILPDLMIVIKQDIQMTLFGIYTRKLGKVSHKTDLCPEHVLC